MLVPVLSGATTEEVDDMGTLTCMPASLWTAGTSRLRRITPPMGLAHATGLPIAGTAFAVPAGQVALLLGAGYLADKGSPPRGAPV